MGAIETVVETEPRVSDGSGMAPMKRHIVRKSLLGGVSDEALCGALWDRLHPQRGEICGECLEIYRKLKPGWPLPR